MKKKLILMSLLLSMMATVPTYASVETTGNKLDEVRKSELIQTLSENLVPDEQIKVLIEKLERGEEWDCFKKSELEKVPNEFNIINLETSPYAKKYYRFSDGSYIMLQCGEKGEGRIVKREPSSTSLAIEPMKYTGTSLAIEPMGYSGTNYGIEYWDWKIEKSTAFASARFYFDGYQARLGCGPSSIKAAKWGVTDGFGATAPTTTVERPQEILSTSQAALARMWWQSSSSVSGGWGPFSGTVNAGSTCELWLALVRGNMYIDSKLPY